MLQPDDASPRVVLFKVEDVANVGPAPAVDRLVFVAHDGEIAVGARQQANQVILGAVGVLIFVDHQVGELAIVTLPGLVVTAEQLDGEQQQVVKVGGIAFHQRSLVALVNGRERLRLRVDHLEPISRRFAMIFGVRDAREHGAVLHELLVDVQVTKGLLDDAELIVGVVDGEVAGEFGAQGRETVAIAAQEADAERVKRGQHRRMVIALKSAHLLLDAFAHFTGGLIRKSDGEDAGAGNLMGSDEMADAMGDDPGFAGTGTRQNQQRTVDMRHGVLLFGV